MRVKATYRHVFNVTRDVEVPDDGFEEWARLHYGSGYDRELAIAAWLDDQETEFHSDVFHDWRINEPLPPDFELQYSEVEDVEIDRKPVDSGS